MLAPTDRRVHVVSSPEAAELTKLYENTFRAVNLAFANEMADVAAHYGLDPIEVTEAAATKPYGFMAHYPGAGVGGHCIPVRPLLPARARCRPGRAAPLIEQAMAQIAGRPAPRRRRAAELLARAGSWRRRAVLMVGVAYKPGVEDTRESPALEIAHGAPDAGRRGRLPRPADPALRPPRDARAARRGAPGRGGDYDLVVVATVHAGSDYAWLRRLPARARLHLSHAGGRRAVSSLSGRRHGPPRRSPAADRRPPRLPHARGLERARVASTCVLLCAASSPTRRPSSAS